MNAYALDYSHIKIANGVTVFLSILVHLGTNKLVSGHLSTDQTAKEILKVLDALEYKEGMILHSDHGSQYTSKMMAEIALKLGAVQSMGEVGKSLDNREAEYFFSCVKSEGLDTGLGNMSYDDLGKELNEYEYYYNNERVQKNNDWYAPNVYIKQNNLYA